MAINESTPWHKESFNRFLQDRLPQLLAKRLPLVAYEAAPTVRYTCRLAITLRSIGDDVEVDYPDFPQPDEDGLFEIDGVLVVVSPIASQEELDIADISCVGEQIYAYVEERLGKAPSELPWDAALTRAWLPLDSWVNDFMDDTARKFESRNWLAGRTHLRRLLVPTRKEVIAAGQEGRVCPFETPEGPNIGSILSIAVGAEIREGKLVIVGESPEAGLGLSASMIPLLEHNDPAPLLMGANMLRQWIVQSSPEPALVQTGNEPDVPDFWIGRDLLTAFVSWDAETFASGIAISESCARRFDTPHPLETGDKLSNRHGTKGVVSRILPDSEMPHLVDGTPVELVFNFIGVHLRMNFGQVREAVVSRIARAQCRPAIVPPFHAPSREELREDLAKAGIPESGMETLSLGQGGPQLERSSTVGWVYWGRLFHIARNKILLSPNKCQIQGELENLVLRDLGARENLRETLNTRSTRRADADTIASRVAVGQIEQAPPPTPMFSDLVRRLRIAGIAAELGEDKLTFRFEPPRGDVLKLASPVPHPWLHERQLTEIGAFEATDEYDVRPPWYMVIRSPSPMEEYTLLVEANDRLARILSNEAPDKLVQDAQVLLENRVTAFMDALLKPAHLRFQERLRFSGRAVVIPDGDLQLDQVGLGDEIAWALFGPLVIRELGDEEAVRARSGRAARVLDKVMARSWVIINRAPSFSPTALQAYHPVRKPGHVILLHPLICEMLNNDFDGDQAAVFLPITESAQREAGEILSVAGHLARDAGLLEALLPPADAMWGLASLSLTEVGRHEIAQMAGTAVADPNGMITRVTLAQSMRTVLERSGTEEVLFRLEQLMRRGFEVAKASGASISPFIGTDLERPPEPEGDDPVSWFNYAEELAEQILSTTDYQNSDLGPQLLAVKTGARGRRHLPRMIGPRAGVEDIHGKSVIVRRSLVEGLPPEELYACAVGSRKELAGIAGRWNPIHNEVTDRHPLEWFTVLARARRAQRPGTVFARAAASGEVDPLVDAESRLLVGLPD